MDLLLHLLEKNEVDIYDIPIADITQQYLEYMDQAEESDLELTSEFLLMACTLLAIKAKMLLPRNKPIPEDMLEIDPRAELVEKLIEYRIYRDMAENFKEREHIQSRIFYREIKEDDLIKQFPITNPLANVTLTDLIGAYSKVLRKIDKRKEVFSISREEITIKDKMDSILNKLHRAPAGLVFERLFYSAADRKELIITFLALLELSRKGTIIIRQSSLFADILIFLKEKKGD